MTRRDAPADADDADVSSAQARPLRDRLPGVSRSIVPLRFEFGASGFGVDYATSDNCAQQDTRLSKISPREIV